MRFVVSMEIISELSNSMLLALSVGHRQADDSEYGYSANGILPISSYDSSSASVGKRPPSTCHATSRALMTPSEVDGGHSVMTRPVLSTDPAALVFAPTLFSFGKLFSLEMLLAFPHAKPADHLCERIIFVRRQVLRDVAQNDSFGGSILRCISSGSSSSTEVCSAVGSVSLEFLQSLLLQRIAFLAKMRRESYPVGQRTTLCFQRNRSVGEIMQWWQGVQ
jgi:hypothetical protein